MSLTADILGQVKRAIRDPYAWPGGYPMVIIMADGEVLAPAAARENWPLIVRSTLTGDWDGWRAAGATPYYEGPDLICAHSGVAIPSAYGDPDADE